MDYQGEHYQDTDEGEVCPACTHWLAGAYRLSGPLCSALAIIAGLYTIYLFSVMLGHVIVDQVVHL